MPRHGMARRWRRYQARSAERKAGTPARNEIGSERDMDSTERIRADFERVVKRPEATFDLARAALLIAAEADPNVDVDGQIHTLDSWAAQLRERLDPSWNNLQKLARLRSFVYEDLRFRGDHRDYYSPSNSLLHQVMDRRLGIPLTLSIIFMELGWRVGIPFEGVAFPGHFLVRLAGEPRDLLLDPYERGTSVHEEDCRRMLHDLSNGKLELSDHYLLSVSKRDMITRLLMNLKGAYLRAEDDANALAAVDRLLVLKPDDLDELRDRGLLLYRLQRYGTALEVLRGYLESRPDAPDRETMAMHVRNLKVLVASLN
jgi:regulator of sirC expression with transglutaminase-like and TPR domain